MKTNKPKIVVLGGGNSPEREVSLRSSKSVIKALQDAYYDVEFFDPKGGLDFLDNISSDVIVFPILHGAGGEDGTLQKELEARSIKFLGSDSISSKNCFDKFITRKMLNESGVRIPNGKIIPQQKYATDELAMMPHVLKVVHGGSSIGTLVVKDPKSIDQNKVDEIFGMGDEVLIEEYIEGIEITVPILGAEALPVIEIIPPESSGFDYSNKYNGKTQELCPPVNISSEDQKMARTLAEKVHRVMGCRHISRTDMIVKNDGEIFVLEINTIPGMTEQSLYPRSAKVAGYDMPELVTRFVGLVANG